MLFYICLYFAIGVVYYPLSYWFNYNINPVYTKTQSRMMEQSKIWRIALIHFIGYVLYPFTFPHTLKNIARYFKWVKK